MWYLLLVPIVLAIVAMNIYVFMACWQKGRRTMFCLGIAGLIVPYIGIAHWIGAIRLARPESKWAQEKYGPEKMARSRARFGDQFDWTPGPPLPPPQQP